MAVKTNSLAQPIVLSSGVSALWLGYFIFSIALIGGVLAFGLVVPIYLLSRDRPRWVRLADRVMVWGISLLMRVQPWYEGKIELDLLEGTPDGALIVSNHRSHLDAFILLSSVQGVRILAKAPLFRIPFLGLMMRVSRQIPSESGAAGVSRSMDLIRDRLRRGDKVHVFPEMTRCAPGWVGTQKFLLAPFQAAIDENRPIVPVVIRGTDRAWPRGARGLKAGALISAEALGILYPLDFANAAELCNQARLMIEAALPSGIL